MTAAQWSTVGVITAIVALIVTIYFARQASVREAARANEAEIERRVGAVAAPLHAQLEQANRVIDRRDATIALRDARIDQLEDELRRGRGYGDDDRLRQPPGG